MLQFSYTQSGDDIYANPWIIVYINLWRVHGMLSGTEVFSDCVMTLCLNISWACLNSTCWVDHSSIFLLMVLFVFQFQPLWFLVPGFSKPVLCTSHRGNLAEVDLKRHNSPHPSSHWSSQKRSAEEMHQGRANGKSLSFWVKWKSGRVSVWENNTAHLVSSHVNDF